MHEPIIGIDLGTTNSEVAIVHNGKTIVIADNNGHKILPSVVGMSHDGTLLIGEAAKNQYVLYPERTIVSIKRRMGHDEKVQLHDTAYSPQEISAFILKRLKTMAESYLQCQVAKAVITVPAYFSDAQRQATREAGELAGLEVVRIINEPTAAALAYGVDNQTHRTILVYDLGGGTFDVSVVSLQSQVVEVLASTGNNHLGGDDFDTKIVSFIEADLSKHGIDINQSAQARARIRRAAETAKITLSDHPFALIEEEYLLEHNGKPYHLSLEISRQDYQEMISPLIEETLEAVRQALDNANLMASEVDEILLVGGSTRTPMVIDKLTEIFNKQPRFEIDPELCVAMGAAIQAGIFAGEKCDAVLVDVTPYTFGTCYLGILDGEIYPHVYKALIQKNTPIPVTKSEVFFTANDNQETIEAHVYQGEDLDALQNIEIGTFRLEGLSKVPSGNPIVFNFKLDLDGILHVTAKEKRSGLETKLVINNAISQFTPQEMQDARQRIEQLFNDGAQVSNPDIGQQQGAIAENTRASALDLIKKAEQSLNQVAPDDKEDIVNLLEAINDALVAGDAQILADHTEKLSDMLFYLEASVS